jgi:hypothetical protein
MEQTGQLVQSDQLVQSAQLAQALQALQDWMGPSVPQVQ